MGLGVCVHDAHVVNNVSPILPEVMYQEVNLLFRGFYLWSGWCGFGPIQIFPWPLHGTTCEYEGVVAHVSRCEGFAVQFSDPITEVVVTRRYKADPLSVEGMEYGEIGIADVAVLGEFWGT